MWWIWLVPSLVVAGALLALAASALEVRRKLRRVRRGLADLADERSRAENAAAELRERAQSLRDR